METLSKYMMHTNNASNKFLCHNFTSVWLDVYIIAVLNKYNSTQKYL